MIRHLLALSLLFPALAAAQPIYKWQDSSGNTHFSDQPHEGAERVELQRPSTYSVPNTQSVPPAAATNEEPPVGLIPYKRFAFASPGPEQTLRQRELTVSLALEPALRPGHRVRLLVDGTAVAIAANTGFPLQGIERGTHTLAAEIIDGQERVIARAGPITFYIHLPSVQNR